MPPVVSHVSSAALDRVERVTEVAFGSECLALHGDNLGRDGGEGIEILRVECLEQRDRGEAGRLHGPSLRPRHVNAG